MRAASRATVIRTSASSWRMAYCSPVRTSRRRWCSHVRAVTHRRWFTHSISCPGRVTRSSRVWLRFAAQVSYAAGPGLPVPGSPGPDCRYGFEGDDEVVEVVDESFVRDLLCFPLPFVSVWLFPEVV